MIYKVENISDTKFTDTLYEEAYKKMSDRRKEKANRYKSDSDKKLCVFSDMLLREMLSTHFGIENPEFYLSKSGKPCLVGDNLHFSISHSGNFIACAVDISPVGIDIEAPRAVNKKVIDHCCVKEESEYISSDLSAISDPIPADTPEARRFLSLWTAKEAYLKYTGEGLKGGLNNIITIEKGKLKNTINNNKLFTIVEANYVLSIISEHI